MKCSTCQTENPDHAKFCHQCGTKLQAETPGAPLTDMTSERKHVTVLFSDVSGYTAMSEKLDPEEVTEIMSRIFGDVTCVVNDLGATIDKFIGDAVLVVFGIPNAHEDDAARAIMAAQKIHGIVDAVSPDVEVRIGRPLSMHTGINSGVIVTGEMDVETGKAGITGDTINLASRLEGLAEAGEILVGPDTYHEAACHFEFEALGAKRVKGKAEPIHVYKVLAQREHPERAWHLHGVRAAFIGREAEMEQLRKALEQVRTVQRTAVTICGDAGTGKSRLVEEFKLSLNPEDIHWIEAFAYDHCQQTPYSLLIDLLAHAFQIDEHDPPEILREKLETGIKAVMEDHEQVFPYIASLFSLSIPEIETVSPEFWKSRLHEGIARLLAAYAQRRPTVVCLEDLHWADSSSVELVRSLATTLGMPLLLLVYRPLFTLFIEDERSSTSMPYLDIRVRDLTAADAEIMLQSLLQGGKIPSELVRFVQNKAEGNPFYLEEIVNTLLETGILRQAGCDWTLTKPINEIGIPATIRGVLTARLDRLEHDKKRIVQEASVIGREFFYDILQRISAYTGHLTDSLTTLQGLDLIRLHRDDPDLEYIFKHALTQEVAYHGLLKKERREIHEQIAQVIERLFHYRLPEFYEALAFHYARGKSLRKGVEYLMKSGHKSIQRYAAEEAHRYYQEAFDLQPQKSDTSQENIVLLIDLLIEWAFVFYYRAEFKCMIALFFEYRHVAESLHDKARLGMFYAWLGFANFMVGNAKHANRYLRKALELGEESDDQHVIGYACCWLAWNSAMLGRLKQSISFGERAHTLSKSFKSDQYLYFKSLAVIGFVCMNAGDARRATEVGKQILAYGQRHSNIRSMAMGHICLGINHVITGDISSAIECYQQAVQISVDPAYSLYSKTFLGFAYILGGHIQEAEQTLQEAITEFQEIGYGSVENWARGFFGVVHIMQGRMNEGMNMLKDALRIADENETKSLSVILESILGNVYLQLVASPEPPKFSVIINNLGFLIRHLPFAAKKAEQHLTTAIEMAKDMGANFTLAQAYLDLGRLYKAKKKPDQAKAYLSKAITIFKQCRAKALLKQAQEVLES